MALVVNNKCCCEPTDVGTPGECGDNSAKVICYDQCADQWNVIILYVTMSQRDVTECSCPTDGFYAMMVMDEDGEDSCTFTRVRSTDPDVAITMTVDKYPVWPFHHGPGSTVLCPYVTETPARRRIWLIRSITFECTGSSVSYTRADEEEDADDPNDLVIDDPESVCCARWTNPITFFTRRIWPEDTFYSTTVTVDQSGVVSGDTPWWESCGSYDCSCANQSVTLYASNTNGWPAYDGYYVSGSWSTTWGIGDAPDCASCTNLSGDPPTYPCYGLWGGVQIGEGLCYGGCYLDACTVCHDGGNLWCTSYSNSNSISHIEPCNDKHPLYDPVTEEEWMIYPVTPPEYRCAYADVVCLINEA